MKPRVTVLIPSYNPGDYLRDALASLLRQTYKGWRAVVVDDGSTDDSLEKAGHLLRATRASVIRSPVNLGQSKASNLGLKKVETPWTVQLDADDWFPANALEILVSAAGRVPCDVAVLHGNMKIYIEEHSPVARVVNERYLVKRGQQYDDRYTFLLSNASVWPRFYRTSALRRIGGWPTDDPYEGRYLEDKRILFRLIEHYRFHWIDEVLYVHRRHDYNQTDNKMAIYRYTTEWNIRNTLRRWGDPREPVFHIDDHGWKRIVGFRDEQGIPATEHRPEEDPLGPPVRPLFEWPSARRGHGRRSPR